ncbi:Pyocin-S1 [compost metagenome]
MRLLTERAASLTAQHATAVAQQAQREAEARRVADELARASAQAEANRIAQEQARVAAEKEAQRIAEEQARITTEAIRVANTYRAQGSIAAAQPLFITSIGTVAVSETARAGLQTAIRAVVTAAAGAVEGIASGVFLGASALLYSPSLGNGELPPRFAFSIPLSDLAPNQKQDLAAIAAAGGSIDLQVRIGSSSTTDEQTELFVAPTNATTIPSKVRVVAATYDVQQRIYEFSTPDTPPRTLTWTPIVQPGNSSTDLPAEQPAPSSYTGATVTALEGRIDTFPDIAEAGFDDYVVIFPVSDLPPLYVMFRDRRGDPGVATGIGQTVSGNWLASASQVVGAPIPMQIADQLRGKEFKSFRRFREAFWKAVARDPELSQQFKTAILESMRKGRAATAADREHVGSRTKIELHHDKLVSQNGEVYDIDNIRLMTPKRHITTHKEIKK